MRKTRSIARFNILSPKIVISQYILKAEKVGVKKINFIFGSNTKVSFSILL